MHPHACCLLLVVFARAQAAPAAPAPDVVVHGRVETHGDLRILRTWGTPAERGFAHGYLLASDIAAALRAEWQGRFARQPQALMRARKAVAHLIAYPADLRAEIDALADGLRASGVDCALPEFGRAIDRDDLLVVNALDVFGLLGCSGFVVHGDQVVGGGVLTARNFDWPLTGEHLVHSTILLVQHDPDGGAVASVTWPGFVGVVTGVNADGLSAYLHVGNAVPALPRPRSWPTAVAARAVLEQCRAGDGVRTFAKAEELLGHTSASGGFLTRIALGAVPGDGAPFALFETDVRSVDYGCDADCAVVTNHFVTRTDGRKASPDSLERTDTLARALAAQREGGDRRIDVDEAWQALAAVQRDHRSGSPTLHAIVFRHAPWCFELRLAQMQGRQLIPAPASARRCVLRRDQVFAVELPERAR